MKRLLLITLFLITAAVLITVVYFKNLNLPGKHANRVMQATPADALLLFEFNNDSSFYDIFKDNTLLPNIIGGQKTAELNALRLQLLLNPTLKDFFSAQHIFISLHIQNGMPDFLLTTATNDGFKTGLLDELTKKTTNGVLVNAVTLGGKPGYTIYLNSIKERFYLVYKADHILTGSFSKELAEKSAQYVNANDKPNFALLPDQQSANSLANMYINYKQLSPLTEQLFSNKNIDIFKNFRSLGAFAALSLNYKSDALMFSGFTTLQANAPDSYLTLFSGQQPVINRLKDIFPATTAYSINFAVSDAPKFEKALSQYHDKAGLNQERAQLFGKIKTETGIQLNAEFNHLLSNEFAVITTRYQEKIAIISVTNGSLLRPFMVNVSSMINDDQGQLKYSKLPFYLLGDAFSIFSKPYFMIIDNYLILANSAKELSSYYESYTNHKFLSKISEHNAFEALLAERSNVALFVQFKNAGFVFKRDMKPDLFKIYETAEPGFKNYYAASYQFTASDKDFYTDFCMRLNKRDTTTTSVTP